MNTIITSHGYHPDDWGSGNVLTLQGDCDHDTALKDAQSYQKIIINFSSNSDGRGFSLARYLREQGFKGYLRAQGALVPDQWRHLMSTGFNDLSLTQEQIIKMPLESWAEVQGLVLPDYREKLFGDG